MSQIESFNPEELAAKTALVDRVVAKLEAALLPDLERRRARLAEDARYSEARVFSLRHSEIVHAIGVTCHPIAAASADASYCFIVNVIGVSGISLRGFVSWYQPIATVQVFRHFIDESMTPGFKMEPDEQLDRFLASLPALFKHFERGVRRGRPPSAIRQLWNRMTSSF